LVDRPNEGLKIYNRGISGNKVFQLAERWQQDCLDLKPNLVSVLIGVNDLWHRLNGKYDGTVEVTSRITGPCSSGRARRCRGETGRLRAVCATLRRGEREMFPAFDEYRAAARRVAGSFQAAFVPFQALFDEAVKLAPPQHWAGDGVHPAPSAPRSWRING